MQEGLSRRRLIAIAPALPASAMLATSSTLEAAQMVSILPAGVHTFDRSDTISDDIRLEPGARIYVAEGAILSFLGHFSAPISHIFMGPGQVDLTRARIIEAYPEWWGAEPENGESDCSPAFQACLAAHTTMRLGPHSYFCSKTLVVDRSNRRIIGAGSRWLGPGTATRIVHTGEGDVLHLGSSRRPGSVNDFVQGVMISDLQVTRARAVAGGGHNAPSGLRARFLLFSEICRVDSAESVNGFAVSGVVRSFFRDCSAFRSPAGGTRSGSFRGFSCDGNEDIGLAGGNGSVYFIDCLARTGGRPNLTESIGMLLEGAFADTFIGNFETAEVGIGIRIDGKSVVQGRSRQKSGYADLRIAAPVLDQCGEVGIEIHDTSDHALIDVSDPYIAAAAGSRACLALKASRGQLSVRGGQLLGWFAADRGSHPIGLALSDCTGVDISGLKLLGFRDPVQMTRCAHFRCDASINQPERSGQSSAAHLSDCRQGFISLQIKGVAGAYAAGVTVAGNASRSLDVELAGIGPEAVGGVPQRLVLSGAPQAAVSTRA